MGSYTKNRELSIYVAIGWLPISDNTVDALMYGQFNILFNKVLENYLYISCSQILREETKWLRRQHMNLTLSFKC